MIRHPLDRASDSPGESSTMTPATILIVEDEAIVALDLQRRLQQLGYRVPSTAGSGEEAIRLAGQMQPDLVCMDIGLRGDMDGIEAAVQIRTRFGIPSILLTAYSDVKTRERAEAVSLAVFLTKPFEDEDVLNAIQAVLSDRE